ncbi:MAG: helicase-exonuclease AddAB subunit AddB [Ignavibacteriales bacterium]
MILSNFVVPEIDLDVLINDHINSEQVDKILIVVPTNRRLRQIKKKLIEYSPRKSLSIINIETLWTLAKKILMANQSFIEMDDSTAKVLLGQCFDELSLPFFRKYHHELPFGTLEKIKNYFSLLKENGIYPKDFSELINKIDDEEKAKAADLSKLFSAYIEKTTAMNLCEIGDVFYYINQIKSSEFKSHFENEFPTVNKIIFLGFDELRKPELEFISKLSSIKELMIILKFEYYKYNPKVFGHLIKTFIGLKKIGFAEIADKSRSENSELILHIKKNLFRGVHTSKFKADRIYRIKAENRLNEIEIIAKEIKTLILEQDVDPNEICVAFNLIENYSEIVREVFHANELPVNLTDRFLLNRSLPIISLINILEILESNFHYKSISRAFSNSLISHSIDLNNLIKFSRKYKLTSNYNRWIELIEIAKSKSHEEDFNYDLQKVRDDIGFIKNLVAPFEKRATLKIFLEKFRDLLAKLNLIQNSLKLSPEVAEKNIRSIEVFFDSIHLMTELIEKNSPDKEYDLSLFLDIIRRVANHTRFNVKERQEQSILVTSINEIRGMNFDYLFVAGLSNKDFPTKYSPELIASKNLAFGEMYHLQKERFYFYQAISSWNKNLYLSFPSSDNNAELVESNFLVELSEIIELKSLSDEKFKDYIFTLDDEYKLIGQVGIDSLKNYQSLFKLSQENFKLIHDKLAIENIKKQNSDNEYQGNLNFDLRNEPEGSQLPEAIWNKEFSATEMETFSKCGFQYFMKNILKIYEEEEPTEMLESLELGNYLHRIFFEFFVELRKRGLIISKSNEKEFSEIKKILFATAERVIPDEIKNSNFAFYEIEKIFGLGGNKDDSILMHFLNEEKINNNDFTPEFFEVAFGRINAFETDYELGSKEPVIIDEIKFKGKIDRIDLQKNDERKSFNIVDYKLGNRKPSRIDVLDGISLQLQIYALAARALLENKFNEEFDVSELKLFFLKYSNEHFGLKEFAKSLKLKPDELMQLAIEKIQDNVKKIQEGNFSLTKIDKYEERVCKFCSFKTVCRIDEIV